MAFSTPAHSAITARVDLRYGELYRTWLPLIIIQFPGPTEDRWPVLDPTLQHLRDAGWAHPGAVMRGAHLNAVARATVDGALLNGPVSIAGGGLMLYQGTLHRSPAWIDAVRAAGSVAVIATTLDDDCCPHARDGEVLGAHGVLFHRSRLSEPPSGPCPHDKGATLNPTWTDLPAGQLSAGPTQGGARA